VAREWPIRGCEPWGAIKRLYSDAADLVFLLGAGDGKRTRTISLGICLVIAVRVAELRIGVPASDRGCPPFTTANGTLMAR